MVVRPYRYPLSAMAIFLIGIYVACELIANVTASKPVAIYGIVVPAAVFIYALTFTLVDLINEELGKKGAQRVVYTAFLANVLLALYVQLAIALPPAMFYKNQEAFESTLGSTPRIVIASLIAYLVSSLIDTEVFAWWRERIGKWKWARVLLSNAISTLIDSITFITLAFAGTGLPLLALIQGQYIVKMSITVISIPLIYLVKSRKWRSETKDYATEYPR
jgi:uncharacterized integral membrane protein (TIGR00697 family)